MPPNRNKGNAPRCMEDFVWDEAARSDRLLVLRRDPQPHRDHRRFDETVMPEKFLGDVLRAIGQKCDAQKILLSGKFDGVIQQLRPVTFALILVVNDQIFEQDHKPALGCADGEKKVDHPNDGASQRSTKTRPRFGCSKMRRRPRSCLSLLGRKSLSCSNNSPSNSDSSSKSASVAGSITTFSLMARRDYPRKQRHWQSQY